MKENVIFENTRKPVGLGGRIMASMMNLGHTPVASWGLEFLHLSPDANVLDCGCGGGANIKRLLKKCPNGTVTGIDYSSVSVEKSKKLNAKTIAEGHCRVLEASVAMLPFENEKNSMLSLPLKPSIFLAGSAEMLSGSLPGTEARRNISHLQREQRRHG